MTGPVWRLGPAGASGPSPNWPIPELDRLPGRGYGRGMTAREDQARGGAMQRWWQVMRHGACPACGTPHMVWSGIALVRDTCRTCQAPLAAHEATGRTLYPVILPLVVVLVLSALAIDDKTHAPLWLQALGWVIVVPLAVSGAVRAAKAAVLAARVTGARA